MVEYNYSSDYDDPLIAELYDRQETYSDDVELIRELIAGSGPLRILECFSGTGRILVPLALEGHEITGIEIAQAMSDKAAAKIAQLGKEVSRRVTLKVQDALDGNWGSGYDLIVLGGNIFYELPSPEMQERCIHLAREALDINGWLFVDNNDYKGDWGRGPFGEERVVFEGTDANGNYGRLTVVQLSFDERTAVLHMKRTLVTRGANGEEHRKELLTRKHPVTAAEVRRWIDKHGFDIVSVFGDRRGNPYTPESRRAIFWAKVRPGV